MTDTEALALLIIRGFATLRFYEESTYPQAAYDSIKEDLLDEWEDIKSEPNTNDGR